MGKTRKPGYTAALVMVGLCGTLLLVAGPGACSSAGTERASERTISTEAALADFDRAWQIIYESHFDETFNGVDWHAVRDELRPQAAEARSRSELRATIQEMLDRLGQSHFAIIPQSAAEPQTTAAAGPDRSDAPDESGSASGNDSGAAMAGSEDAGSDNDVSDRADSDGAGGDKAEALAPGSSGSGRSDADTGLSLRVIDGRAVVSSVREGSPADEAGVQTGWVLTEIGSSDVDEQLEALTEALSEEEMGIHAVALLSSRLQGPEGSTIDLTFLDAEDQEVELEVGREPMPGEFVKFGNLPPMSTHLEWSRETVTDDRGNSAEIGIIRFNIWMIPIAPKFERAMYELRDADGIIIDLRGNPGGVGALSSSIGRFLMSEKGSLGTMTMRGAELSFNIEPVVVTTWGERLEPFKGPVAILQDSGSASTSEVFAGGLQSLGRVKVFGTRSAGMALPAAMVKLPSGDVLLHAIADFVTSTGERMEHGGVVPDVRVELSREDLLRGIDTPEQAAKEWISETTAW